MSKFGGIVGNVLHKVTQAVNPFSGGHAAPAPTIVPSAHGGNSLGSIATSVAHTVPAVTTNTTPVASNTTPPSGLTNISTQNTGASSANGGSPHGGSPFIQTYNPNNLGYLVQNYNPLQGGLTGNIRDILHYGGLF